MKHLVLHMLRGQNGGSALTRWLKLILEHAVCRYHFSSHKSMFSYPFAFVA